MAGTLRPPSNRLTRDEEASYVIHNVFNEPNYYGSTLLFDGIAVSSGFDNTSITSSGLQIDIEFFDDVIIWDIGYYLNNSPLAVYDNSDGVKKNKVSEISPSEHKFYQSSADTDTWSKVGELPKGRYLIYADETGQGRTSYEWFFEKSGSMNKTLILHDGEYKKFTDVEMGEKINPVLSSDTSNGEAFGSSLYGSDYSYFHAFDEKDSTSWTSMGGFPQYIGYGFIEPTLVVAYSIKSRSFDFNDIVTAPKSWTFEGSNDKQYWTTLDTQSNQVFTQKSEEKLYLTKNTKFFKYYRINVTQNNGFTGATSIGEMKLYEGKEENLGWNSISSTLPTSQQFLSEGMDSLSPLLDRKVETLKPLPMTEDSTQMESGKVFTKTIDLKKYLDIRSMKVKVK